MDDMRVFWPHYRRRPVNDEPRLVHHEFFVIARVVSLHRLQISANLSLKSNGIDAGSGSRILRLRRPILLLFWKPEFPRVGIHSFILRKALERTRSGCLRAT
jgi:hypothetical protein